MIPFLINGIWSMTFARIASIAVLLITIAILFFIWSKIKKRVYDVWNDKFYRYWILLLIPFVYISRSLIVFYFYRKTVQPDGTIYKLPLSKIWLDPSSGEDVYLAIFLVYLIPFAIYTYVYIKKIIIQNQ